MDLLPMVVILLLGIALGGGATYLVARHVLEARSAQTIATLRAEARAGEARANDLAARLAESDNRLRDRIEEIRTMSAQVAALTTERAALETQLHGMGRIQDQMKEAFASLSARALQTTSENFFHVARRELESVRVDARRDLDQKEKAIGDLLMPIREGLLKYDRKIEELARDRDEAFGRLTAQLQRVEQASASLGAETQHLARALRSPSIRGKWGELQLRRVVEVAGMLEHCDFVAQPILDTEDGSLRPDVVIKLPGGRAVAIDAKVPLTSYLEAVDSTDDEDRKRKLKQHAIQIRTHADLLGRKGYWERLPDSPEFVVLFLPSEVFFSAALEHDPRLIEDTFTRSRVIIATPTTLIALLQAVAHGWRQDSIARNAEEIAALGKELYERLSKLDDHFGSLGVHLEKALKFYNSAVGTLESRVLVSARRFKDLGVGTSVSDLAVLEPLETPLRDLRSAELTDGNAES